MSVGTCVYVLVSWEEGVENVTGFNIESTNRLSDIIIWFVWLILTVPLFMLVIHSYN